VATGSLGQGLPTGVDVALAGKRLDRLPSRISVLCGDSEMSEGSIWEAFEHAGHGWARQPHGDHRRQPARPAGETMHAWDLDRFVQPGRPTVIVARTIKGKGVRAVENQDGKHGKPIEDPDSAVAELGGVRDITVEVPKPTGDDKPHAFEVGPLELPRPEPGEEVATWKAYGEALAALGGGRGDVVGLDAEIGNSTHAEIFAKAHPERFFEMYIAEQQMVAVAVGLQVRSWVPFASTFAAFLARAYDFVRMAAVSRADICVVGSHTGVSIGEDGPSQMGLEDRTICPYCGVGCSLTLHMQDNQIVKVTSPTTTTSRAATSASKAASASSTDTPKPTRPAPGDR